MKKILLLIAICGIFSLQTVAGTESTDKITVSELQVQPGGEAAYFDVSLQGSEVLYTAYQLVMVLPEGLSVDYNSSNKPRVSMRKSSFYPSIEEDEDLTYFHTFSCTYGVAGERTLKVMCYSTENEDFTSTQGTLFRVYVKASPYMKPGLATIQAQDIVFTTKDEVQYDLAPASFPITIGNASQVALNISATQQWNTCVLPFDAVLPTGVRVFEGSRISGDYLFLSEASSLQAFTPYILYAKEGYSGTLQGTVDAGKYMYVATGGILSGAIMPQEITQGYVMQDQGEGMNFYNVNNRSFTIPSGKCWVSDASGVASIRMGLGATDISLPGSKGTPSTVYSLDGKRISNPQGGHIYIIGGKKVLKLK